jgi:hypothetical protein
VLVPVARFFAEVAHFPIPLFSVPRFRSRKIQDAVATGGVAGLLISPLCMCITSYLITFNCIHYGENMVFGNFLHYFVRTLFYYHHLINGLITTGEA